jgi:NitT/TauT family transport system permease protein
LSLSNYVIPGPFEIWESVIEIFPRYLVDVLDTLVVAIIGHFVSILLAMLVGIIGRLKSWIGSLIKVAAYNIQAYPVVAVAPIIFILFGDRFLTRLIIAAMICYFPLLLTILGILTEPVVDIEHFYDMTERMNWWLQVKIRIFENIEKLTTVIAGSVTLAMGGTIVAEFIAADAGIGYSIRIALYQSDMAGILIALFLIGIWTSLYLAFLEWIGLLVEKKWKY